jgi:hypothetical protein
MRYGRGGRKCEKGGGDGQKQLCTSVEQQGHVRGRRLWLGGLFGGGERGFNSFLLYSIQSRERGRLCLYEMGSTGYASYMGWTGNRYE